MPCRVVVEVLVTVVVIVVNKLWLITMYKMCFKRTCLSVRIFLASLQLHIKRLNLILVH